MPAWRVTTGRPGAKLLAIRFTTPTPSRMATAAPLLAPRLTPPLVPLLVPPGPETLPPEMPDAAGGTPPGTGEPNATLPREPPALKLVAL